ncbi:dihydroxyacetone kinase subunit DhaL [Selenomonas sp.]|uniref:dihydroxyacetone kinase subunit DhaL n=1 Tax=Selenomonas sp. TaxID=2053611 RepID=UPI0025CEC3BF|nr:dihydroxyacetone kinase subunit DhaL [Selenomonas sp.]MCI6285164.1 dihydroxyacetone kinase subunit L [Selenomonas sp.]
MDNKKLVEILQATAKRIEAEKAFLTELDNEIGDGDHGINLARGFAAVEKKLPELADKDIGAILKGVGMALVSSVGGASGPLYGTAYMKAGAAMKGKTELTPDDLAAAFDAAIGGVQMRGKAHEGEKTMLDAQMPASKAYKDALAAGKDVKAALKASVEAARKGVEYTKTILATKGRASYLGERSIGHQDPGATSSLMILEEFEKAL